MSETQGRDRGSEFPTVRASMAQVVDAGSGGLNSYGLNNRVRLIVRRAFGCHSAQAAVALVMLTCGPIDHVLPHERMGIRPHRGQ